MRSFQRRLAELHGAGADLYGVSVDSPWALNAFQDLTFDVVSNFDRRVTDSYGVHDDFPDIWLYGLAERAVLVVDGEGTVRYA